MSGGVWLDAVSVGNKYVVCQYDDKFASFGHFLTGRNPLSYSGPLLFIQISTIAITSQVIEFCLRPLGQSSIVAHILGGVLYGPSILGNKLLILEFIFPPRSIVNLEIVATFGIMFFLFAIGVKQDSRMMIRPGKQAAVVGIASVFGTLLCTMTFVVLMKMYVQMNESLSRALPYLAVSQGLSAFPNVACLLAELKMSSTQLGRIANSAAMLCDLLGLTLVAITLGIIQSEDHPVNSAMMILSTFVFVLTLLFVVGPIIRRLVKTVPPTRTLPGRYVLFCFLGTLMTGLASEVIGQHFLLGPLVFGLLIPDGQPLGEPIISKLDYPVGKLLYPTFLTTSGLKTNFFTIDSQSLWIVVTLIFFSCMFKVISVVVSCSLFDNIKVRDSVVVGLMMNSRGISELILYNLLRESAVLSDQEFALSVLSVIMVTAVIAPLIRLLYNPLKSFVPQKRTTIQHMNRDAELRIVVCIKNQGHLPTMINILEASNATDHCPIAVIAVVLIELVGRATAMLVAHQSSESLQPNNSTSAKIINALHQYKMCHESCVSLQTLSCTSHEDTTHDDICRVALDHSATIVIMPFHKYWEIDGSVRSESKGMQAMNLQVMNKAPCTVGILVDRGILNGSLSILNNQSTYRVGIVYIGGPDDAESLSYGARMGRHLSVNLTVVRFLFLGHDTARDRRQDNLLIDEVRQANIENQNFIYQEKVVKDGVGLAATLRDIQSKFDLIIVGKNHQSTEILMELGAWIECDELGVVGDLLAAPDFESTTSVLVIQQQNLTEEKLKKRMSKPVEVSYEAAHDPMGDRVPAAPR